MLDSPSEREHVYGLGSKPSVVEGFGIHGLYGYRSITLTSGCAASILIARNGSGKTTLLGAMDAFLRGHFTRLRDIPFDYISCKLRDHSKELVLQYSDLKDFFDVSSVVEFMKLHRRIQSDGWSLLRFLVEDYDKCKEQYPAYEDSSVYTAIGRAFDYNMPQAFETCDKLQALLFMRNDAIRDIKSALTVSLSGIDIVYLPTYRRIELPLVSDTEDRHIRKRKKPEIKFGGSSLFTGDIQFGLTDISERLSQINSEISAESSIGYREISANIIEELIDDEGRINYVPNDELPTKPDLELFFSRIKDNRYLGPYTHHAVPNIGKIYSGHSTSNSTGFLRYYLAKLDRVIKSTKDVESRVVDFVQVCNTYLSADDESTTVFSAPAGGALSDIDSKSLILDRRNLTIHVENLFTGLTMSIDSLSSGEKQMISLFARLYLYTGNKIVLIDEPELSLSLDWQRQILVDVLKAPLCLQIVAITHSPFVFDNALDAFAGSLKSSQRRETENKLLLAGGN